MFEAMKNHKWSEVFVIKNNYKTNKFITSDLKLCYNWPLLIWNDFKKIKRKENSSHFEIIRKFMPISSKWNRFLRCFKV